MNIFNFDPLLLEFEVQELKDKVKHLEDGQCLMMNNTTPSTIHTEPSTVCQTLPPTTPSVTIIVGDGVVGGSACY